MDSNNQVKAIIEKLEISIRVCKNLPMYNFKIDDIIDENIGENEMAVGDFIIRGRFRTLKQMIGEEI